MRLDRNIHLEGNVNDKDTGIRMTRRTLLATASFVEITSDLYTNVLAATQHEAAEAAARLLRHATDPRCRKSGRKQQR